jgi:hypothetical protein
VGVRQRIVRNRVLDTTVDMYKYVKGHSQIGVNVKALGRYVILSFIAITPLLLSIIVKTFILHLL